MNKRAATDNNERTPSSSRQKVSRLETGIGNIQQLVDRLAEAQPNNNIIKELQDAVDNHVTELNTLLAGFETPEEKERKRSLVVIGLPEPEHPLASGRVKADAESVSAMLDVLNVEAVPVAVYRMGRPPQHDDNNKKGPRLLKVVLPSSQMQHRALGALKTKRQAVRNLPGCNRVLIRPSMTPEEREKDRELQERLRKKRAENPGVYVGIKKGEVYVDASKQFVPKRF
jgi:hypothetical protein